MQQNHSLVAITICLLHKNSLVRSTSSELHTSRPLCIKMQPGGVFICLFCIYVKQDQKKINSTWHSSLLSNFVFQKNYQKKSLCDLQFISSSIGDNWLCQTIYKFCFKSTSFGFSDVVEKALNWKSGFQVSAAKKQLCELEKKTRLISSSMVGEDWTRYPIIVQPNVP